MLKRILDEVRHEVLREERRLLGDLRVMLVRLEAPVESQKALVRSITQLDELFMLVVVGEFNAGKSAVINALLGDRVVEEGPTPTTARVTLLKHGAIAARAASGASEAMLLPLPILREITIVDTPGTNAVLREHEALTREFVPRSDLVLFVTSADRPFTESERQFLEVIQSWGKKIVLAVNKVDILESPKDVAAVLDFVREKAVALLGLKPQVFAVSARLARKAKTEGREALWRESGFLALETFVTTTLHEAVRVRLKLLSPLGVGLKGLEEAEQAADQGLALLKGDLAGLEEMDAQLLAHREDLGRGARLRAADVEKAVLDFERRGREFLGETLRLSRIGSLLGAESLASAYEYQVAGDLPRVVEKRVDEIVAWMGGQRASFWKAVSERLRRRPTALGPRSAGIAGYDPSAISGEVRREALRALELHDPEAEARRLAGQARTGAAGTIGLLLAALAVTGGTLTLAETTGASAGGLLGAGVLALLGLLILPLRRLRSRAELAEEATALRERLTSRLRARLEQEIDQDHKRLLEAVLPYRRFVRSESDRFQAQRAELGGMRKSLQTLKARIESL